MAPPSFGNESTGLKATKEENDCKKQNHFEQRIHENTVLTQEQLLTAFFLLLTDELWHHSHQWLWNVPIVERFTSLC